MAARYSTGASGRSSALVAGLLRLGLLLNCPLLSSQAQLGELSRHSPDLDALALAFVPGGEKTRRITPSTASAAGIGMPVNAGAASSPTGAAADGPSTAAEAPWEAQFRHGVQHSKHALEATASNEWVMDSKFSNAAVPAQILHAEELMHAGTSAAPEAVRNEKVAERALRLYYHAKWLAERNYMRAAEWRYREAARLAKECRRRVLASHALSRLGYFLMYWNRRSEARECLAESEALNAKSNTLAPFLIGVLDRQDFAEGDVDKLRDAEDRILAAGEQPSQELEASHQDLVREIKFWRRAEEGPRFCTDSSSVAHVLICFLGHAVTSLRKALLRR